MPTQLFNYDNSDFILLINCYDIYFVLNNFSARVMNPLYHIEIIQRVL